MGSRRHRHGWSQATEGLVYGTLGMLGFSLTLPATRVAVGELDATLVGLGRAVVAAGLALAILGIRGEAPPPRRLWARIGVVAVGVVLGFPLFSALALHRLTSAHSAVIVGLLPAATAVMAVARAGERPPRGFWIACACGLASVLAFAASEGAGTIQGADVLVLIAVAFGALGYAEGGGLSREIGGWRVICWALVASLPITAPATAVAAFRAGVSAGPAAWAGVARVAQVQLLQPILTLVWSALLIGERISATTVGAAILVVASVAASQRAAGPPVLSRPATARRGDEATLRGKP